MGTQEPASLGGTPADSGAVDARQVDARQEADPAVSDRAGSDGVRTQSTPEQANQGLFLAADGTADPGTARLAVPGMQRRSERAPKPEDTRHARNLPPDEPAARFETREKPQRYATGIGQRQPTRPLDPIRPYMAPPVARRRRADWSVMVFAMVVTGLVMIGCCVAGFALYSAYGNPFAK